MSEPTVVRPWSSFIRPLSSGQSAISTGYATPLERMPPLPQVEPGARSSAVRRSTGRSTGRRPRPRLLRRSTTRPPGEAAPATYDLLRTTIEEGKTRSTLNRPVSRNSARKRIASRFEVVGAEDLVRRPRNEGSSPSLPRERRLLSLSLSNGLDSLQRPPCRFRQNAAPRKHPSGPHIACQ